MFHTSASPKLTLAYRTRKKAYLWRLPTSAHFGENLQSRPTKLSIKSRIVGTNGYAMQPKCCLPITGAPYKLGVQSIRTTHENDDTWMTTKKRTFDFRRGRYIQSVDRLQISPRRLWRGRDVRQGTRLGLVGGSPTDVQGEMMDGYIFVINPGMPALIHPGRFKILISTLFKYEIQLYSREFLCCICHRCS